MHAAMHRARPEPRSLVHVHSPHLTALAALAEPPADLLMLHASFWPDRIPLWERPELVRDQAAGDALVRLLGDSALGLLRRHGAVVMGRTLRETVFRTVLAERHAGPLLASLAHSRPLAPVTAVRDALYADVLPSMTHDLNRRFESSYVRLDKVRRAEPLAAVGRHYSVRVVRTACRS